MNTNALPILTALILTSSCGDALVGEANGTSERRQLDTSEHRKLDLTLSRVGGFDNWSGIAGPELGGAALGFVIDEEAQAILVVALRFDLPLYTAEFDVSSEVGKTASSYEVAPPVDPLADAAAAYPLLAAAVTDSVGIWNMEPDVTAVLLEGDLQQDTPESIFVADSGTLTLFREDGPYDLLAGSLTMIEVDGLGDGATTIADAATIEVEHFNFEWDTDAQP